MLGVADPSTVLIGTAGDTTWAYRVLPREAGPPAGQTFAENQLAFETYTDAAGWQVAETPLDRAGNPWRGPDPNRSSARITPGGGGLLVGRSGTTVSVLVRSPGGRFREAPAIPTGLLREAAPTPTPTPTPTATATATASASATATATASPTATATPT